MNIFKEASKNPKVTFNLGNGEVTVVDLWRYDLERLDNLYSRLHNELESTKSISLLKPKESATNLLELKLAIVKDVVETILEERQERQRKLANAEQARLIREKLADKREQGLASLSEEELLAELAKLES